MASGVDRSKFAFSHMFLKCCRLLTPNSCSERTCHSVVLCSGELMDETVEAVEAIGVLDVDFQKF